RRPPPPAYSGRCASAPPRAGSLSATELRQHLLYAEPYLLVSVRAPQLEHDVRAARVAVLLDRLDAVGRCPGDRPALVEERVRDLGFCGEPPTLLHRLGHRPDLVLLDPGELEQRVGGALDVLHLVREVHAGDLARALAARVAIALVDRGDDGAADVDLAADVVPRVADEGRRRDRGREAAVGDLARELLHLRR